MPSTSDRQELLLGPWPPPDWRRDPEIADRFPDVSLRRDIVLALKSRCGAVLPWVLPGMTPTDVLVTLNAVGPGLDRRALPVVEAILEGMYADGIVGRIPPPTVGGAASYVPREAAERDLPKGKPVMLLPLRGGAARSLVPPRPLASPTGSPTSEHDRPKRRHRRCPRSSA